MLEIIASELNFNYELYLVPDNAYGIQDDQTGMWDGLIGEVYYGVSRDQHIHAIVHGKGVAEILLGDQAANMED